MKAAVQILKKTEDLKQKLSGDILNDNEAWNNHQQLQDLYQQLLVTDLEYSLDKKVEQDLWNYGFKNQINLLQMKAKDRKNPQRNDSQESLGWFLEAASGFYLHLLQELCEAFDLDIPCRRKNAAYGISKGHSQGLNDFHPPMKTSCLYICQHCLVHLGDIARYRNHALQAETFYRHAAELVPSNGQPYNQLAILEAAKGDKLCTVFYYVRSIAVKCPFPVSSTNLQKMYSKMANDDFQYEGKSKLSVYDYIVTFLQFHSLLHLATGLDKAQKLLKVLSTNLTVLIATESLTAWKLIQMTAINIFAASNANRSLDINEKEVESELLSEDEQMAFNLVLELIASTLNGLLLLVYTIKDNSKLKSYYALPIIKLILDWLKIDLNRLKTPAFSNKLQIWPSLCKLLNSIQSTQMPGFDVNKFLQVPLPEDWDLQCFLPFYKAHKAYKFKHISALLSHEEEHSLRTHRLLEFGRWMCEQQINGAELISLKADGVEKQVVFEAVGSQVLSGDVLDQIEEITLKQTDNAGSPIHSLESSLSNESFSTSDKRDEGFNLKISTETILKNSLENSFRERRSKPNIALQTIMQKKSSNLKMDMDDHLTILKLKPESKQVTFKTPSPSPPASSSGTPPLPYALSSTPSPVFHNDIPQMQVKKKAGSSNHSQQDDVTKMYQGVHKPDVGHPYNYSYFSGVGLGPSRLPAHHIDVEGIQPNSKMMIRGNQQSPMMYNYQSNLNQPMPQISPTNRLATNRIDLGGNSLFGQQQWSSNVSSVGIEQMLSQLSFNQVMQHPPTHLPPPPLPPSQGLPNSVGVGPNRVYSPHTFPAVQRPQFNQDSFMYPTLTESMTPYSALPQLNSTHNQNTNKSQMSLIEHRAPMLENYPNYGDGEDGHVKMNSGNNTQNTYSLFNSSWSSGLNVSFKENEGGSENARNSRDLGNLFQTGLPSLWSGPGPSPLERLLEQQKQKEPAPH